jgi:alcohol dehydrogenase class IV
MKTLIAALIALGGGTTLGVAAVVGVQAAMDPDSTIEQSSGSQINVMEYGDRS